MKKHGFTLAETLITLTIIGVVAAMTIPTLMSKYQDHANEVALKKYYSVLANAVKLMEREHGPYNDWGPSAYGLTQLQIVSDKFEPFLKFTKKCTNTQGCWHTEPMKNLSNTSNYLYATNRGVGQYGAVSYIMSDGTLIALDLWGASSNSVYYGVNSDGESPKAFVIYVDVNGNKGPNRMGFDVFTFVLTNIGFFPSGTHKNNTCSSNSTSNMNGFSCTTSAIKDGISSYK